MANKIRSNPKIKGIKIREIEYIISQFADDTDLYLSYEQETATETLNTLTDIEKNTGLRVSYDKTTMYHIGSIANTDAMLYTSRKVNWSSAYINTLGIDLHNDPHKREENLTKIVNKMKVISRIWYYRNMTLMGKVLIINTLMSSLYVYAMQVLQSFQTS